MRRPYRYARKKEHNSQKNRRFLFQCKHSRFTTAAFFRKRRDKRSALLYAALRLSYEKCGEPEGYAALDAVLSCCRLPERKLLVNSGAL